MPSNKFDRTNGELRLVGTIAVPPGPTTRFLIPCGARRHAGARSLSSRLALARLLCRVRWTRALLGQPRGLRFKHHYQGLGMDISGRQVTDLTTPSFGHKLTCLCDTVHKFDQRNEAAPLTHRVCEVEAGGAGADDGDQEVLDINKSHISKK